VLRKEIESTLQYNGKTLQEWKEHFTIKINPNNVTPSMLKEISAKLILLNHEASFNHSLAQAKKELLLGGANHTNDDQYMDIVQTHKLNNVRTPAAPTIKVMANKKNANITMAATIAEVEMRFWKNVLDNLSNTRKLIEQCTFNSAVELKQLNSDRLIENMTNKVEKGEV